MSYVLSTTFWWHWNSQPIQNQVGATRKAPPPVNITELESFLGVMQYYAKFIPNLSTVLHPLHNLRTVLAMKHLTNAKGCCLVGLYSLTTTKASDWFLPRMQAHMELELWSAISCQMGWKTPLHLHHEHWVPYSETTPRSNVRHWKLSMVWRSSINTSRGDHSPWGQIIVH